MWDPGVYQRYADERSRPFHELVSRIRAQAPSMVVDLGCGPGNLTATLAHRWAGAAVHGIDSSPEMIESARGLGSAVDFQVGDVRDYRPGPDVDVIVSNATLQWVPGHAELVAEWARDLRPGGWLGFQVPGNFEAPSHRALRAVAESPGFAERLDGQLRDHLTVADPAGYAVGLIDAGCAYVDAWETTYLHMLPVTAAAHPVLTWMEGTALRPVRKALDDEEWADFQGALTERLRSAYPEKHGLVPFPFRRIFVVAQR
jgi:trans-aconitate 2-methyltransferase